MVRTNTCRDMYYVGTCRDISILRKKKVNGTRKRAMMEVRGRRVVIEATKGSRTNITSCTGCLVVETGRVIAPAFVWTVAIIIKNIRWMRASGRSLRRIRSPKRSTVGIDVV